MKRLRSRKGIALILAALAVIAGGGAALAAEHDSPASAASSYLEGVAKHLGVSTDELKDAMKAAALDEVDAALADRRLTQEEADALTERIQSDRPLPFFGPFFGPRFDHFPGPPPPGALHFFFGAKLATAAGYLDLTEGELQEKLNDGSSLAEVAEAEGKSVAGLKQALVDAVKKEIDQAVEEGELTRAEADDLEVGIEERIDNFVEHAFFRFDEDSGGRRVPHGGPFW